jgi:hypothetical protein
MARDYQRTAGYGRSGTGGDGAFNRKDHKELPQSSQSTRHNFQEIFSWQARK